MMNDRLFRKMAQRLQGDRDYLSYFIGLILRQEDISWDELAQRYQMSVHELTLLALCRRPRPLGDQFANDVQEIASVVKGDVQQIVSLIRYGEALAALDQGSNANDQSLSAARDRDDED